MEGVLSILTLWLRVIDHFHIASPKAPSNIALALESTLKIPKLASD